MQALTPGWTAIAVVGEGQAFRLGGVDIWQAAWRRVDEPPITVPHPGYPHQRHAATRYVLDGTEGDVRFAACELSPNCWGFYTPD